MYLIKCGYIWVNYIPLQHSFGHGDNPLMLCNQQLGNTDLTTWTWQLGTIDFAIW